MYKSYKCIRGGTQVHLKGPLIQSFNLHDDKVVEIYQNGEKFSYILTSKNFFNDICFDFNHNYNIDQCIKQIQSGTIEDNPLIQHFLNRFKSQQVEHTPFLDQVIIDPLMHDSVYLLCDVSALVPYTAHQPIYAPIFYKHWYKAKVGFYLVSEDESTIYYVQNADNMTYKLHQLWNLKNKESVLAQIDAMQNSGEIKRELAQLNQEHNIDGLTQLAFKHTEAQACERDTHIHFTADNETAQDPIQEVRLEGKTIRFAGKKIHQDLTSLIFFNHHLKNYYQVIDEIHNPKLVIKSSKRLIDLLNQYGYQDDLYLNRFDPKHFESNTVEEITKLTSLNSRVSVFDKGVNDKIIREKLFSPNIIAFSGNILNIRKCPATERYGRELSFVLLELNPNNDFPETHALVIIDYTPCKMSVYHRFGDYQHEKPIIRYIPAYDIYDLCDKIDRCKESNFRLALDDLIEALAMEEFPSIA